MATGDTYPVVMGADKAVPNGIATLGADGKVSAEQWPTLPQMGAVPVSRTVNKQPLSSDIVLTPGDVGAASNPNLLENWYFADPINQRGQTEYTEPGYTIDRWYKQGGSIVTLESDGICSTGDTSFSGIIQSIDDWKNLIGQTITFSVLIPENTIPSASTIEITNGSSSNIAGTVLSYYSFTGTGVFSVSYTVANNLSNKFLNIMLDPGRSSDNTKKIKIKAAKLELGSNQTLAHQDASGNWVLNDPSPNKALELAKCQRYYYSFGTTLIGFGYTYGGGTLVNGKLIAPQMRANPVLVNNKTRAGITTLDVAAADGSGAQHTKVPVKILSAYGGIGLSDTSLPNAIPVTLISQNNAALDANL